MRDNYLHRIRLAGYVTAATALVLFGGTACSSSNNSSGAASSTTAAAQTTSAIAGSPADEATVKKVTDAYVTFFDGNTPADKKIELLENGQAFAPTINAQANSPMAKGTTATVSKVTITAPDHANVVYTVSLNGTPALQNQQGAAVQVDGQWKVAQASFCALMALEQNPQPACSASTSVTPTTR
ncbi:hypothetical protein FOS14_14435 [Skermania sp. ID1734]|uniref:hypothetical protein n=1 Tax=Skermania sp. ID1734 TaxID=2597516 RepID=UPI00117CD7BF|nr:hypothetical protein [Skermania sp. ID1734]TSD98179.1 hypothetical protein FOS14_14435 [Skermania sp. ID1734]